MTARLLVVAVAVSLLAALALGAATGPVLAERPGARYLVGFRDKPGAADEAMVRGLGGEVIRGFDIVPALAVCLPERAVAAVARNPNVAYVEEDGLAYALEDVYPWGVTRVGADIVHATGNYGAGVNVAVLDTGITSTHPDLAVAGGVSFVAGVPGWEDDNGHGTFVAGVVAAMHNEIGIIGVAPAVNLYAVKVLNAQGSGYVSDIVAGIDWVRTNGMKVVNMSLGTTTDYATMRQACDNAYTSGLLLVAPSGGSGVAGGVAYPARYESVIACAAIDQNNQWAPFSTIGPEVELSAPGVQIYSTYGSGGYATMSGTSFACPHVAGVAALVFAAHPSYTNVQVRWAMDSTAIDLGAPGHDPYYGWGLVYAPDAVAWVPPVPALTVTVATDKTTYSGSPAKVTITTSVTDPAGGPAKGASVSLVITNPLASRKTASGTTGSNGKFVYSYTLYSTDPKGTYEVTATATKTGYTPGSGSTSFVYK